jgi:hypothetical protein
MSLVQFSDRTLNFVASMVLGQDARVLVSPRFVHPLSVAFNTWTISLNHDAGLYDLFLGARLLSRRKDYKRKTDGTKRISQSVARDWTRQARQSLVRDFPRLQTLNGFYHPSRDLEKPPHLMWDDVDVRPLAIKQTPGAGFCSHPGVIPQGAADDFKTLLAALSNGTYPMAFLPEMPEIPVATIPYELKFSQAFPPTFEQMERILDGNTRKLAARAAVQCFVEHAESKMDMGMAPRRYQGGIRLDSGRLVQARIACRTGQVARIFRKRDEHFQPFFDPSQHVIILGCHVGSRLCVNVAMMVHYYLALNVDFVVMGYGDRLVTLADGRSVYLHIPIVIKGLDDAVDGPFWHRLLHLKEQDLGLPGEPACFHPLLLSSLTKSFDKTVAQGDHHFCWMHLMAFDGMPSRLPELNTAAYWARTAQQLDSQFDSLFQRHDDIDLRLYFMHLNSALQANARPGGYVASFDPIKPRVVHRK